MRSNTKRYICGKGKGSKGVISYFPLRQQIQVSLVVKFTKKSLTSRLHKKSFISLVVSILFWWSWFFFLSVFTYHPFDPSSIFWWSFLPFSTNWWNFFLFLTGRKTFFNTSAAKILTTHLKSRPVCMYGFCSVWYLSNNQMRSPSFLFQLTMEEDWKH